MAVKEIHGGVHIIQQVKDAAAADPASLRHTYLSRVFERMRLLCLAGIDPKAARS